MRGSKRAAPKFLVYRIYNAHGLLYVGQTVQPLRDRLRGHFFAKPMMRKIDPRNVVRVEYAECVSRADMDVYERYYIEFLKPPLNCANRERDELTVRLPELAFAEFGRDDLMEKWRAEIALREKDEEEQRRQRITDQIREREERRRKKEAG
jgi:hypothetical protein